jgi:hypothetical protein
MNIVLIKDFVSLNFKLFPYNRLRLIKLLSHVACISTSSALFII